MSSKTLSASYYSGLSGIQLPVPKYLFPPAHQSSSRLVYYSTFFNSIEINSSFYKIPMKRTVEKWSAAVSNTFRFTFKLFREITHVKNLNFSPSDVECFLQTISAVGAKKGCLLLQFPPSLKSDNINELDRLLNCIRLADTGNQWRLAVEFRNKGWYNADVYELLNSHKCTMVIQDIPASATPLTNPETDTIYIRFHGPTGNYRGSYTDDFLLEYSSYIREWLGEGRDVYVYFNNTMGNAFNNLATLNRFISRMSVSDIDVESKMNKCL